MDCFDKLEVGDRVAPQRWCEVFGKVLEGLQIVSELDALYVVHNVQHCNSGTGVVDSLQYRQQVRPYTN